MKNAVYNEIAQAAKDSDMRKVYSEMKSAEPWPHYKEFSKKISFNMRRRDSYIKKYGWCIPDLQTITKLATYIGEQSVLSVGAGNALVEFLLREEGVSVIA